MVCKRCGTTIHAGSLCSVCRGYTFTLDTENSGKPVSVLLKSWHRALVYLIGIADASLLGFYLIYLPEKIDLGSDGLMMFAFIASSLLLLVSVISCVFVLIGSYRAFFIFSSTYLVETILWMLGFTYVLIITGNMYLFFSYIILLLRIGLCIFLVLDCRKRARIRKTEEK